MKTKSIRFLAVVALAPWMQTLHAQSWNIIGNSNTNVNTNFLGTTNNAGLVFRTNNIERMRISSTGGNLGIGLSTGFAGSKLQVANGSNVSLTSPGHFVLGLTGSTNMGLDRNVIQARNNGAAASLFLNFFGGAVSIGGDGGSSPPAIFTDANRKVGIDTSTPATELNVVHGFGSINHGLRLQHVSPGTDHNWTFYTQSGGALELSADGTIRGTFNPTTGAYTASSDRRVKKDIENAGNVLSRVLRLDVIKYHALESAPQDPKYYGLIAQDVEPLFPEIVDHNRIDGSADDFYTMNYSAFGVLAIKAIQEQQQEIKTLQDRIAKLEAALAKISSAQ